MKITIKGKAKEIAALVLALQERQDKALYSEIEVAETIAENAMAAWKSPAGKPGE